MTYLVLTARAAGIETPAGSVTNNGTATQQFVTAVLQVPTPAPAPVDSTSRQARQAYWEPIIRAAAMRWGADPGLLVRIADCESGFRPVIKNATSTASGLYQYIDSTWASMAAKYGVVASKSDGMAQADLTARIIAAGGVSHWNASRSCWGVVK